MKTTPSYVTITLDCDRKLILTADQAVVVLKAIEMIATGETVKIEMIAAQMLLDEAPTAGE